MTDTKMRQKTRGKGKEILWNFDDFFIALSEKVTCVLSKYSKYEKLKTQKLKCWVFIKSNRILVKLFQKKPK